MARSASGRTAERPAQFDRSAWRDVVKRAGREFRNDNLSIVSAGVAFYAFLSIFPAIAAFIAIYGMMADPENIQRAVTSAQGIVPQEVIGILSQQMTKIGATSNSALGTGAILALLLALWSATNGTKALMQALNIAYEEEEKRGFLRLSAVAILLTLGAMLAFVIATILVVAVPALIGLLPLPQMVETAFQWLRWPLLALGMMVGLSLFYRYAPSRAAPRWQWVSIGAVVATVLWLIGSALFSWYVSNSGSYNATYGSLAAIVIMLMWAYISAMVVLLGAELNSEMEHQTARDTTTGREEPMGERGAAMADTVAPEDHEKQGVPAYGKEGQGRARHAPKTPAQQPERIENEIARTRRDMDETLHELRERLSSRQLRDSAAAKMQATGAIARSHGRGSFDYLVRERPLLLGALGVATGAIVAASMQHREHRNG